MVVPNMNSNNSDIKYFIKVNVQEHSHEHVSTATYLLVKRFL